MKRFFYGFEQAHGGATWIHQDGRSNESGSLHRFESRSDRDRWLNEDWKTDRDINNRNERRAILVRFPPYGWRIYGPNHSTMIHHDSDGSTEWIECWNRY